MKVLVQSLNTSYKSKLTTSSVVIQMVWQPQNLMSIQHHLTLEIFNKIGNYLHQNHLQLLNAKGFDHHFIFNANQNQIQLKDEKSGRKLTFSSTQNGAQIYTANWFEEEHGKGNSIYRQHDGIAIEPQWMPDAINRKEQPSLLKANQPYHQVTTITFDIDQIERNII